MGGGSVEGEGHVGAEGGGAWRRVLPAHGNPPRILLGGGSSMSIRARASRFL